MINRSDSFDRIVALPNANATASLGARLASISAIGDAVLLYGGLGAGKTTCARGLIAAWTDGCEVDAPSPTYTIIQWYDGPRGPLAHLDLYRVSRPDELDEIGLEDALDAALCVIEWPDRLAAPPQHRIDVRLTTQEDARVASIRAEGRLKERIHDF